MRLSLSTVFIACVFLSGARLLFPEDMPFNTDERQLLTRAWEDNQAHAWTTHGLRGTRGMDYGPVPLLIYRGALHLTEDLPTLVVLKAATISLLTLAAVFGCLVLCPWLSPWTALAVFLSPYFWMYSRDLWDNSWNIPITALCFVSYLAFVASHRRRWLAACAFFAVLALQIHLLCLPLLTSIAGHFLLKKRDWAQKHRVFLGTLGVCFFALLAPYVGHVISSSQTPATLPLGPGLWHFVFAFLGPRLFTAVGFEYFLGPYWYTALPYSGFGIGAAAVGITLFALVAFYRGVLLAWKEGGYAQEPVKRAAGAIALGALGLHTLLVGAQQLINHPHYYGSVWIAYFYLFALGLSRLTEQTFWKRAAGFYFTGLAFALLLVGVQTHRGLGLHSPHYGEPLRRSEAARALPFFK